MLIDTATGNSSRASNGGGDGEDGDSELVINPIMLHKEKQLALRWGLSIGCDSKEIMPLNRL